MQIRQTEPSVLRPEDRGKPFFVPERNVILLPSDGSFIDILDDDAKLVTIKGDAFYVVPNNPRYAVLLRHMGHDIISPIIYDDYDWCGAQPYAAQVEMAGLLVGNQRVYNLSDMGCGKTLATLLSIDWLMKHEYLRRVLVVAPLSILNNVWQREITQRTPRLRPMVLYGSRAQRLKRLADTSWNVAIINHDGIKTIQERLLMIDFQLIVIDEISCYRDPQTNRWKVLAPLVRKAPFAVGLSGSPMPVGPWDVYGQIKLLQPEKLKMSFTSFRQIVATEVGPYIWKPKVDAYERIYKMMQPAVRFKRNQIIELKDMHHFTVEASMSKPQVDMLKELKDDAIAIRDQGIVTVPNAAVMVLKLLQASAGAIYTDSATRDFIDLQATARMALAKELIDQAEGKVLLFVPYRHIINLLHDYLKKDIECAVIHGGIKKRDEIFNDFKIDGFPLRLIIAQPSTMAHGLNLHVANTIIWYAPTYKLEIYQQANGRVTRPGQTREQFVYHIQSTAYEAKVYQGLASNANMQALLLQLFEEFTSC